MIIEAEEDETFWELSGSHLCEERKSWDMGSAFVHNMPRQLSCFLETPSLRAVLPITPTMGSPDTRLALSK